MMIIICMAKKGFAIIGLIRVGAQGEEEGDCFVGCVQSSSHQRCSPIFVVWLQGVMINCY